MTLKKKEFYVNYYTKMLSKIKKSHPVGDHVDCWNNDITKDVVAFAQKQLTHAEGGELWFGDDREIIKIP